LFLHETNYHPEDHTFSPYSGPVVVAVSQYFSMCTKFLRAMFETLNALVDPGAHFWERGTCDYATDDSLQKIMDAIPEQVAKFRLRLDHEMTFWGTEDHIRYIRNSTDREHDKLPLYKENLSELKMDNCWGTVSFDTRCSKLVQHQQRG
jgi:hypothetical protein